MADDLIWRLLRRFGRAYDEAIPGRGLVEPFTRRLDRVEREQREIEARLELLERQADPRRLRRDDD